MELPRRTGARKPRRKLSRRAAPDPLVQPGESVVALGVVMGTHGVRGELRVKLHNPTSELLFQLDAVLLRVMPAAAPPAGVPALATPELRRFELTQVRPGSKGLLIQLAGIDSVERAQALRGAELCVGRSRLPELPEGEFYHFDLEGLALQDREGRALGTVERVHEYPAASVLRVRTARGLLEVPMREPYVVEIDLPGQRIVVDQLDDLDPERV